MWRVFSVAAKQGGLDASDLPPLEERDDPATEYARWTSRQATASVAADLHALYWRTFWYAGFLFAITTVGGLTAPMALHALLDSIGAGEVGLRPLLFASALAAATAAQALTIHLFWFEASRVGLHAQNLLTCDVLAKALSLSPRARVAYGRGTLVNLMAVDACRINDTFIVPFLHWSTWGAYIPAAFAAFQLWALLGAPGLLPLVLVLVYLPTSAAVATCAKRSSESVQVARDARGRLIAEAIAGAATLKILGAEDEFAGRIEAARATEVGSMARRQYLGVVGDFLGSTLVVVALAVTFGAVSLMQREGQPSLDAATAFTVIAWVNALAAALRSQPNFLTSIQDIRIAATRLSAFSEAEDVDMRGRQQWETVLLHRGAEYDGSAASRNMSSSEPVPMSRVKWAKSEGILHASAMATAQIRQRGQVVRLDDGDGAEHVYEPVTSGAKCGVGPFHRDTTTSVLVAIPASGDKPLAAVSLRHATIGWMASPAAASTCAEVDGDGVTFVPVLHDVSFDCAMGSLTLIVGAVGSGKSAIIATIVGGDAALGSGDIRVRGSVAYCAQTPWIRNATLRENVIFDSKYDESRYTDTLVAVALNRDVDAWPEGDDTLIGDAGVTLSGGQRARVALARALYADADVYVLDDVLSALDATVAAYVWTNVVVQRLRGRGKTTILATHAVHFAERDSVDAIVSLSDGCAKWGAHRVEASRSPTLRNVAAAVAPGAAPLDTPSGPPSLGETSETSADASAKAIRGRLLQVIGTSSSSTKNKAPPAAPTILATSDGRDELHTRGTVRVEYIWRYIASLGPCPYLLLLLLLYGASQGATVVSGWWMVQWTTSSPDVPNPANMTFEATVASAEKVSCLTAASLAVLRGTVLSVEARHGAIASSASHGGEPFSNFEIANAATLASTHPMWRPAVRPFAMSPHITSFTGARGVNQSAPLPTHGPTYYAAVYIAINGGLAALTLARMLMLTAGAMRAATALHNAALRGVLGAPLRFFALNPSGRIANRLVADVATVDNTLRYTISQLAVQVFALVGAIVSVAMVSPIVLAVGSPLAALYWMLGTRYRIAARDLRRLTSIAKSPLLAHYTEALRGASTIRAFGPQAATAALGRHLALCRAHAIAFLGYWSANEFISVALEAIGAAVVLAAALLGAASAPGGKGAASAAAAANVGFALSFALQLPATLMWLVRQATLLETDAIAVERLCEYAELQPEVGVNVAPPWFGAEPSAAPVTSAHPCTDGLVVDHLSVRYAQHLPLALRDLCLVVPRGARLAVVGRTGAGKSTLAAALLRLVRWDSGGVILNGVNLGAATVSDARQRVTGVPQEAMIFKGPLRASLLMGLPSPATVGDADMWAVLHDVGVDTAIAARPGGLDAAVEEGGGNFSAGERQLLCLARALLRLRSPGLACGLLLVDEPTANCNAAVDAVVHDTLLGARSSDSSHAVRGVLPSHISLLVICHRIQVRIRHEIDLPQRVSNHPPLATHPATARRAIRPRCGRRRGGDRGGGHARGVGSAR